MPRPLKSTNPYASWTALFGGTLQRLRLELSAYPVVTQAEFGRRVCASGSKVSAIERGQVRPDAAFVEACERELPAGGILRAMLPLVLREWEQWARLGAPPPTGGLLPPDGVAPPGEVGATAAELADVAFLEAAADGAVEAVELAREAEASDIGAGTLENIDLAVDRLRRDYASAPPALLIPVSKGACAVYGGCIPAGSIRPIGGSFWWLEDGWRPCLPPSSSMPGTSQPLKTAATRPSSSEKRQVTRRSWLGRLSCWPGSRWSTTNLARPSIWPNRA
jgi:hypothetical protein